MEIKLNLEKVNHEFLTNGHRMIMADHITQEVKQNFHVIRKDGKWLIFKDEEAKNFYLAGK